jgi:DNA repair protein RadD
MIFLRPYQMDALEALRAYLRQGMRRLIIQASTGSGKTVCAAELLRLANLKGTDCLFLAHRRELVHQCSLRLEEHGVTHGIIMAGKPLTPARVQIASKDTLLARAVRRSEMELPPAGLLIVDEAHVSLGKHWLKLLGHYRDAVIIGLTATPARSDGRGLGTVYQAMHQTVPPSQLIKEGYLVPTRVFAPYRPDLRGVRLSRGEYHQGDLAQRMDKPQLVGGVVEHWLERASDRLTFVFATNIAHSLHLRDSFQQAGVEARHIDGATPHDEREQVLAELRAGKVRVVCNVGILPEGIDVPPVSCAVLARPTRSLVLFHQIAGRIKRPFPGKKDAILLDHAGAVFLHGFPDADLVWSLDPAQRIQDANSERQKREPSPITCPACSHVFSGTLTCPECGHVLKKLPRDARYTSEGMGEVTAKDLERVRTNQTPEAKIRYWHVALACMANKGRTTGAAAHMYKRRFGCFPEDFLPNLPRGHEWRLPVAQLYPQYLRQTKNQDV